MIDVPDTAELSWGEADIPLAVNVYDRQASTVGKFVAEREKILKAEKRYPANEDLYLYFETIDGSIPGLKHIVSQQDFGSNGMLRIESYYPMGDDLVILGALPLAKRKAIVIGRLNSIAERLRPRAETELPTEPGVCIDRAFLPDKGGVIPDAKGGEHVQVGFYLKEFPDVNLSIHIAPANPFDTSGDSLERQLKQSDKDNPIGLAQLRAFRRGRRQIHDWKTGYEFLTRTPVEEGVIPHHDFAMKFTGVGKSLFQPYASIAFQSGVGHNAAGEVKPSITDDEAVALWDKLTGSIRVRPTQALVSQVKPLRPLGFLAVTGRTCEQSGIWECDEPNALDGQRRRFIREGDKMPSVRAQAAPDLWQRIKGERPVERTATMWKLVGYDAPPAEDQVTDRPAPSSTPGPSASAG